MQYKIFCDDYILYDSQLNEFQVENPVLKQELNTANELTFTIYQNHPYFNNISKLVEVTGLEPATSTSRTWHSTKLSYTSKLPLLYADS